MNISFQFLLENAAQILSVFPVLYRIALSGIPCVLAFNYTGDLQEWVEYFVASIPLSADKDLYDLSRVSLLITL